jgi:exosortase
MVPPRAWLWIVPLTLLFLLLHAKYFERLMRIVTETRGGGWNDILVRLFTLQLNADWAHILIIPFFSIYYLFLQRQALLSTPRRVSLPGLVIVMAAIVSFIFWVFPGRNDMFQGLSMVACLFGIAWFLLGPAMMRVIWFAIVYLIFTVKVSDMLWDRLAWQLQLIAARSSEVVLNFVGFFVGLDAQVRGATIDLAVNGVPLDPPLNVAEACSGLRMLMAFIALGVAIAFMTPRPWWQRLIMVAATVPIAVLVNVGRVTTLGILYALVDKDLAAGDVHLFIGMLMLIPAAGLCWLLGWTLDKMIIRDDEDAPPQADAPRDAISDRSAPQIQAPATRAHAGTLNSPKLLAGLGAGTLLAGLCGLLYSLGWGVFQPQRVFGDWFEPMWAIPALLICVAALAAALMLVGRLTREERSGHVASTPWAAVGTLAGLLLTATIGLGAMVQAAELVLIKEAIPLRLRLQQLPQEVGSWQMVREHPPLSADIVSTLGTDQYIVRDYQDTNWPAGRPGGYVTLHVAYYTGTPDTVPHVPDRCFVAGGIPPRGTLSRSLQLVGEAYRPVDGNLWRADSVLARRHDQPPPHLPQLELPTTIFTFGDPSDPTRESNVLYFFVANGRFLSSPNEVRAYGLNPRDRYGYHCKVEVQMIGLADPGQAAERAEAFLSQMMPEIMSCLPDWELLNQSAAADSSDDGGQGP